MSQAVARQMVKQRAGVIVNVSSESGTEGSEGQSCYAATKAALNSFTRSRSKELGKYGIRVVGVAPGILEKPVCGHRNMKRRWHGRAISPSSNFARDIPKRHSHRAGRKALGSG